MFKTSAKIIKGNIFGQFICAMNLHSKAPECNGIKSNTAKATEFLLLFTKLTTTAAAAEEPN